MSAFTDWATTLPQLPGFDKSVRLLAKGTELSSGLALQIAIDILDGRWSIGYVRSDQPDRFVGINAKTIESAPPQSLRAVERFGQLKVPHLIDYVNCHFPYWWEGDLGEIANEVARIFSVAGAIDGDAWRDHVYELLRQNSYDGANGLMATMPDGPGNARLVVEKSLEFFLYCELDRDNPREFVVSSSREMPEGGEPAIVLEFRPDTEFVGAYRKLCAVLPGVIVRFDESQDNPTSVRIVRGNFPAKEWDALQTEDVNRRLSMMDNEPVRQVEYGNHPMQVMVALSYRPDDQEVYYLKSGLDEILHAARAEPAWVYGGYVVSLLVPCLNELDFDFDSFVDGIREHMRFFG